MSSKFHPQLLETAALSCDRTFIRSETVQLIHICMYISLIET